MIQSKVAKNIISVFLALVTFFFGIYVAFARVQAADNISILDTDLTYYVDDYGYYHVIYNDTDYKSSISLDFLNSSSFIHQFSVYCLFFDIYSHSFVITGNSSPTSFVAVLNNATLSSDLSAVSVFYTSSGSSNYGLHGSGSPVVYSILDLTCTDYSEFNSFSGNSYSSTLLTYRSGYDYLRVYTSSSNYSSFAYVFSDYYFVPFFSNSSFYGTFDNSAIDLTNIPAEYQFNYLYYDPETDYYTFLTWQMAVGSFYGSTFYGSTSGRGLYKLFYSQNGYEWDSYSMGFSGTISFSSSYLNDSGYNLIYFSDDFGRSGTKDDAFPDDYSIEDTMDNLSHGDSATFLDNKIMCNFTVVDPVSAYTYYPENPYTPDFSLVSDDLYIITTSEGYKFFCYDTSSLPAVGSTFRYYFYNDPSVYGSISIGFIGIDISSLPFFNGQNSGIYYDFTAASIDHADTLYGFTHLINENLISGFDGVNDTIISLNDNIGSMLNSVHARLGNIYSRLSVTNDYLDSMNGSLSSLNTIISNGFDNVISAINDLGSDDSSGSGSVDLTGVEDKIDDLNSNVDEWQAQFNGFSALLWVALGFDEDEVGDDDPNLPNIIDFIQGAITGSAIGTVLGYFNSFDTDTMNGIHFVNDTLTTIWTTCAPIQPLLIGGAVLLVAGMIVKRN